MTPTWPTDPAELLAMAPRLLNFYADCLHADLRPETAKECREYGERLAALAVTAAPVLYVSPGQLADHKDPDGPDSAISGRYLPSRKTPAGKFTQPLYAQPVAGDISQDTVYLLRRLLSNQNTLSASEFRAELTKIVAAHAPDCRRCSGSGEDPEGYLTYGRGPDDETVEGPCRRCYGSGAETEEPTEPQAAFTEASALARSLFNKHFAHRPPYSTGEVEWDLCDSTAGILSQIDNMVCGLVVPSQAQAPAVDPDKLQKAAKYDHLLPYLCKTCGGYGLVDRRCADDPLGAEDCSDCNRDALDAARYRWLRENANRPGINIDVGAGAEISDTLDDAVDAARVMQGSAL